MSGARKQHKFAAMAFIARTLLVKAASAPVAARGMATGASAAAASAVPRERFADLGRLRRPSPSHAAAEGSQAAHNRCLILF